MSGHYLFSRQKLLTFLACERRFQLRYLHHLSWPLAPQEKKWEEATRRGQAFHQMLERHFLDMVVDPGRDAILKSWWDTFLHKGPELASGRRLPEMTITVPVGDHLLTGRFDLLILDGPAGHIYDWKTEQHPRPATELIADWQTRLYLAILAESGTALHPEQGKLDPEKLSITYWFVQQPQAEVTVTYSDREHRSNWIEIENLINDIGLKLQPEYHWPLTDDWTTCARCAYRVYCGRLVTPVEDVLYDWELPETESSLPEFERQ